LAALAPALRQFSSVVLRWLLHLASVCLQFFVCRGATTVEKLRGTKV